MSRIVSDIVAEKIDSPVVNIPPNILANQSGKNITISTSAGYNSATSGTNAGSANDIVLTGGDGGAHTATTGTSTGGAGGDITITSGSGGATSAGGTAGAGGTTTITSGDGANSSTGTDGAGGEIVLVPGSAGGTATTDGFVHITQNPPLVYYTVGTNVVGTGGVTLDSARVRDGLMELSGAGAAAITLPTAANTLAQFSSITTGDTFELFIYNGLTGNATITTNTGLTLHGTAVMPTTTTAFITYRATSATTYDVYITLSA